MRRRDCTRQVSRFGTRPAPRRLLRFRRQSDFCSLPGHRSLPATVGERRHSLRLSARELGHVPYNGRRVWPLPHAAFRSRYHARSLAPAGRLPPGRAFFWSRADRFHSSKHSARRDLFCVSPVGDRRSRVMDSAHCFRLFRDHAALQAVQEELAAGRRNTLVMVVDDDRVYPRDALETYLYYSELLPGAALCFRGAAIPRSLDWRDAKMIYASELREPRRAAVITGCGSYLIQPRFFDESLWDYFRAHT